MATIDLKLKSYDELQFEIMRLNTNNYLKQQQIDQLTNNWNELEEWVEKQFNKIMKYEKEKEYNIEYAKCLGDIYYRMKEIKENNK